MTNLLNLSFPKVLLPIAQKGQRQGLWTNYKKVWADNITHVEVEAHLCVMIIDDTPGDMLICRDLDLYFDPTVWNTEIYGLIYTDDVFEDAVATWWHDTLKFPDSYGTPHYTEQGMQTDDYVSMELSSTTNPVWWTGFQSAHEAFSCLSSNPYLLSQLPETR